MNYKKLFATFALSSFLMVGALFAGNGASKKAVEVKAETDVGTVTVASVRNSDGDHFDTNLYLVLNESTALPDSWDYAYTAVGEEDGVFLNGVKQVGAAVKHANGNDIHYGCGALNDGDVVEIKGTFHTTSDGGYTFSIDYATQRFGGDWIRPLEDYDVVSLKDANMPNIASGATINTDDIDGTYTYTTDRFALPTRKGYFGLTNETGSYAFQFNHQKTATGTGWFHVLIGGRGPLWRTGHFMDFGFLDAWANTGHAQIKEMEDDGDTDESANWTATTIQQTDAIPLGWNVGEVNLLEMGLIKVKNSSQHFVFFKVNGVLKYGGYWTLAEGAMTTKVTLQYAGTDASVSNSIEPASVKLHTNGSLGDGGLYIDSDACPANHNWDDFFMSTTQDGLKLNGVAFGNSNWNYFKKISATGFHLDLAAASAPALEAGDILYIGGMFKVAKILDENTRVLYKVNFEDSYFEYNGSTWHELGSNYDSYEAADFAKDLLKMTRTICTGEGGNNHDALAAVWATLGGVEYYAGLLNAEKADIVGAVRDSSIVVPSTDGEIDGMLPDDAIAAAMYRYDYCTTKYSLTAFVTGRSISPISSVMTIPAETVNINNDITQIVLIVIISVAVLGSLAMFFAIRRKEN